MSAHEQYADDLALYALDALRGEERARLDEHLATCAACRLELEQLRGDTALLALSATGPRPPQRARQRLLDAVAREPRLPSVAQASPRRSWWGTLGWAAALATLVLAASLWKENISLQQILASAQSQAAQSTRDLEALRKIAAPILEPEAQRITLVAAKTPPQPQGKAFYLRNRSSLVFLANNMPPLPPQKAYELWLIPTSGAPIPAGVFKPDAHGSASVVNPPLPAGAEAKAFAITVENEAGSPAPTLPILMMGTGE
ncbi:MAG TPA: anti-sigma factor [Candidatus Eremiobacteraceae bacterium]|nr:anti-sigma factor [Candidatus Eremiobacteraceae bacterium]